MGIIDFQEFMLPILIFLKDEQEHTIKEIKPYIEEYFEFTDNEKQELVSNGSQTIVYNRISWGISYLNKSLLINNTKRGCYIITERGLELLKSNPTTITKKFLLSKYLEFAEFQGMSKNKFSELSNNNFEKYNENQETQSPEELIESNYEIVQSQLCDELLDLILQNSPNYFEKLVIDLLVNMGYGGSRREAGHAVGKSGDEGIDGVINEDRLGLDNIDIQAKRWSKCNTVGRPEIQKFIGVLAGKQANKGIFITTSNFTSEAKNYVQNLQQKVILIDGKELTRYMLEYNVGVSVYNKYVIKKIDYDYFDEI